MFKVCCSKGVGHHHSCWWRTQRQAEEWEKFTVGKHSSGGGWPSLGSGALGVGVPCGCLGRRVWLSLIGPKLEVGTRINDVSVINKVLAILGWLLQGLLAWLPGLLLAMMVWLPVSPAYSRLAPVDSGNFRVWARVLFHIWSVRLFIQPLNSVQKYTEILLSNQKTNIPIKNGQKS